MPATVLLQLLATWSNRRQFVATCAGCGNQIPAGQVMCSACARR